ncbi:MAG: hypothetical protein N2712_00805 [Brevinematales bacterium]|nr:hypothetical protein [Brevinematales bacterium]
MNATLIDDKLLEFLKQNKGIIAFGYTRNDGYPIVEPKFVVDINESENSICFIESKQDVVNNIKSSKSVSVSIFDWNGKALDGFQLKGIPEVYTKESDFFNNVIQRLETKSLSPSFLNEFLEEMETSKIIPSKNFVVKIEFNMKYSLAPSPESAKPIVVIK